MKVENQFCDVFNSIGKLSTEYKDDESHCPVITVPRNATAVLKLTCQPVEKKSEFDVCMYT